MKRNNTIKIKESSKASALKGVEVITHFSKEEDSTCNGDYYDVSININGVEVIRYGDAYHDKGKDKAKGWIDALKYTYGDSFEVVETNIADSEL